ncbi:YadA-like family protein [Acinetobacter guillouiae]|uniref:YadA-like family protein n=1 Tax=Acinetobacter guillouiae TaxID=106649 RepID=UPI002E22AFBB
MNKFYRIIWQATMGTWVAVSETSKGKARTVLSSTVVVTVFLSSGVIYAAKSSLPGIVTTNNTIEPANVCLTQAASNGLGSITDSEWVCMGQTLSGGIALINGITANEYNASKYNLDANSFALNSIAIGSLSTFATADNAIALGNGANVNQMNAVAIGNAATVSYRNGSIAIGDNAKVILGSHVNDVNGQLGSIAIGLNARSIGGSETVIGAYAGENAERFDDGDKNGSGSDSVLIGDQAGRNSQYLYATYVGDEAGNKSIGQHNSYIGQNAARWRTGSYNVALGSNALVGSSNGTNLLGDNNTAIGTSAGATLEGDFNTLTGNNAGYGLKGSSNTISGANSASYLIGEYNTFTGQGSGTSVSGDRNVGFGAFALGFVQGSENIAVGTAAGYLSNGNNNVMIGNNAGAGFSGFSSDYSVMIGDNAGATQDYAVALGNGAIATKENSVVLGSKATSDTDATAEVSATVNGITYGSFAGQVTDTGMLVSVGSIGSERQIKNVGAGAISENSTDAINGSQLYATNAILGNLGNSFTNIFGGNAILNQNGSLNYTNIGGTGKNTIDEAIQASRTTVSAGNNIIVNTSTDPDGHTNYEISTTPKLTANSLSINNGGPVINNTGIDMNNNKITNVAAGTAVTDAVNVGQLNEVKETANKGWNLTTNGDVASNSIVKGGDIVDFTGDGNVVVSNTGNNINVRLADIITVGSGSQAVTIDGQNGQISVGNTTINNNGLAIVGGPSITINGIDAGNQSIVNVGSGLKDATGSVTDLTNAVESNGVNVGDLKQVVNNINTNISAAKTEVNAGKNMTVSSGIGADGQSIYTVATDSKVDFDQVTVGGVIIDKTIVDNNGNVKITGIGRGDLNSTSTDTVNGSQLYETNKKVSDNTANIATNTTNITNNTTAINKGLNFSADSGSVVNRQLGETVGITGDSNIKTESTSNGVKVSLSDNLKVNSITSKEVGVSENLTVSNGANIDMGNNVLRNVGDGKAATDAVNVGQLNSSIGLIDNKINYLDNKIDEVDNNARAGIAQAIATAGLPQAYIPGKSMMAVSGGTYRGESGYAIGLSSISDNGKWVFKVSGSGNSQGNFGGSVGAGIQW